MPERIKIIVMGLPNVGKTTIAKVIKPGSEVHKNILLNYVIEKEFSGDIIQIQVLSGKKQFNPLLELLIKDKAFKGVVYVFNKSDYQTLEGLADYIKLVRANVENPCEVLLGNNYGDIISVSPDAIKSFKEEHGINDYFDFSKDDKEGVEKAFKTLYECIKSKE